MNLIYTIVEMVGIVAFALSGAMVAIQKKLDPFGVMVLGVITALGGAVIRDTMIGRIPTVIFQDYRYLAVAVATSLLTFLAVYFNREKYHAYEAKLDAWTNVFDALGIGLFTVMGMQAGINMGYENNAVFLMFLGLITGIGGGIMRDLLVQRMPVVLYKHVYAVAILAGTVVFLILYHLGAGEFWITCLTAGTVFTLRMLATKYRWNLPTA